MQPCFTPAKQVKASVNLLSILTADLSFEYMDIKMSRKHPCTPSFLSLRIVFVEVHVYSQRLRGRNTPSHFMLQQRFTKHRFISPL